MDDTHSAHNLIITMILDLPLVLPATHHAATVLKGHFVRINESLRVYAHYGSKLTIITIYDIPDIGESYFLRSMRSIYQLRVQKSLAKTTSTKHSQPFLLHTGTLVHLGEKPFVITQTTDRWHTFPVWKILEYGKEVNMPIKPWRDERTIDSHPVLDLISLFFKELLNIVILILPTEQIVPYRRIFHVYIKFWTRA